MKKLNAYANKRFQNLTNALKSYNHLQDPDVLHTIRVEIKRIKALLNLVDFSIKRFKGRSEFFPFRTIFRKAGKIRQSEVIYKLLLQYEVGGIADGVHPKLSRFKLRV